MKMEGADKRMEKGQAKGWREEKKEKKRYVSM